MRKKSPQEESPPGRRKNLAATYSPILLRIVPSATRGLTAEFGMGSGVSLSLWPPEKAVAGCDLYFDFDGRISLELELQAFSFT